MQPMMARQPIFNANKEVYAYELLFRSGFENAFPDVDGDMATTSVISDSLCQLGMDTLTGGSKAFINFTRNVLLGGMAELLPKESVVVEIMEDVAPDPYVLEMVGNLKRAGYLIAVDDFEGSQFQEPLLGLADIIKVDFMQTSAEQQAEFAKRFVPMKIKLLAEKVETYDEFESAKKQGYSLFQGYFFCKPVMVEGSRIPENKMNKVRLLQAVNRHTIQFEDVEGIVKNDVALSYKLLRYINSAFFGVRQEVENIRQALVLLGQKKLRKWSSLMACTCLGENKPIELLVTAVVRAHFCEALATLTKKPDLCDDLFLVGLLSPLDALLDISLEEALETINLKDELKAALLGDDSLLSNALNLVLRYEEGDWDQFDALREQFGLDEDVFPNLQLEAVKTARSLFQLETEEAPVA